MQASQAAGPQAGRLESLTACSPAAAAVCRQGRFGLDSPPNFLVRPKGRFKIQALFNGTPLPSLGHNHHQQRKLSTAIYLRFDVFIFLLQFKN